MKRIYTSYFGKLKSLPNNITPICITASPPDFYKGICYKKLRPSWEFLNDYKTTGDWEIYSRKYKDAILSKLNQRDVINDLFILSKDKDVALICYEKPIDFCHRHLVADWLNDTNILDYKVYEYGFEPDKEELW